LVVSSFNVSFDTAGLAGALPLCRDAALLLQPIKPSDRARPEPFCRLRQDSPLIYLNDAPLKIVLKDRSKGLWPWMPASSMQLEPEQCQFENPLRFHRSENALRGQSRTGPF